MASLISQADQRHLVKKYLISRTKHCTLQTKRMSADEWPKGFNCLAYAAESRDTPCSVRPWKLHYPSFVKLLLLGVGDVLAFLTQRRMQGLRQNAKEGLILPRGKNKIKPG